MPSNPASADTRGEGCRDLTRLAAVFLLFSAVGLSAGITLISNQSCEGLCEAAGLALYGAGGPVSGLFAALAGGLVLAWPVDITLWIVLAFGAIKLSTARAISIKRVATWVLSGAFLWGVLVASLLERA